MYTVFACSFDTLKTISGDRLFSAALVTFCVDCHYRNIVIEVSGRTSSRPAGQCVKQSIGKLICRGAFVRLQNLLEAVRAELDCRGVCRFRNPIGVKQAPITCVERQFPGSISRPREFSEKQTIFLYITHALG